jgi:hypothetical protein
MKTLSGRLRFVVIGVIAIVAVVSCVYFPSITNRDVRFGVEIGQDVRGKRTYAEWKGDGTDFKRALKQVFDHGGDYCICILENSRAEPYKYTDSKCPQDYTCPLPNNPAVNIRTVKVTKSKAADNIAAGESAVNDPHVTYRVQSSNPGEIAKVVGTLK